MRINRLSSGRLFLYAFLLLSMIMLVGISPVYAVTCSDFSGTNTNNYYACIYAPTMDAPCCSWSGSTPSYTNGYTVSGTCYFNTAASVSYSCSGQTIFKTACTGTDVTRTSTAVQTCSGTCSSYCNSGSTTCGNAPAGVTGNCPSGQVCNGAGGCKTVNGGCNVPAVTYSANQVLALSTGWGTRTVDGLVPNYGVQLPSYGGSSLKLSGSSVVVHLPLPPLTAPVSYKAWVYIPSTSTPTWQVINLMLDHMTPPTYLANSYPASSGSWQQVSTTNPYSPQNFSMSGGGAVPVYVSGLELYEDCDLSNPCNSAGANNICKVNPNIVNTCMDIDNTYAEDPSVASICNSATGCIWDAGCKAIPCVYSSSSTPHCPSYCLSTDNDVNNCGGCGTKCMASSSMQLACGNPSTMAGTSYGRVYQVSHPVTGCSAGTCQFGNTYSLSQTCSGFCSVGTCRTCGDGIIGSGYNTAGTLINEQCDSGSSNTNTPCNPAYGSSCSYCDTSCNSHTVAGGSCGDGIKNGAEQCDNGAALNGQPGNSCSSTCTIAYYCGDGVKNGAEQCDSGSSNTNTPCNPAYGSSCSYCDTSCNSHTVAGASCGDGVINGAEQCDNILSSYITPVPSIFDGYTSLPMCGDTASIQAQCRSISIPSNPNIKYVTGTPIGLLNNGACRRVLYGAYPGGYTWVDSTDAIYTSINCTVGNGIVPTSAPGSNLTYCTSSCSVGSVMCGNGILDKGEQCDRGANNGPDRLCSDKCTVNCAIGAVSVTPTTCYNDTGAYYCTTGDSIYSLSNTSVSYYYGYYSCRTGTEVHVELFGDDPNCNVVYSAVSGGIKGVSSRYLSDGAISTAYSCAAADSALSYMTNGVTDARNIMVASIDTFYKLLCSDRNTIFDGYNMVINGTIPASCSGKNLTRYKITYVSTNAPFNDRGYRNGTLLKPIILSSIPGNYIPYNNRTGFDESPTFKVPPTGVISNVCDATSGVCTPVHTARMPRIYNSTQAVVNVNGYNYSVCSGNISTYESDYLSITKFCNLNGYGLGTIYTGYTGNVQIPGSDTQRYCASWTGSVWTMKQSTKYNAIKCYDYDIDPSTGNGELNNLKIPLSGLSPYSCSNVSDGVCPNDFSANAVCYNATTGKNTDADCGVHAFLKCLNVYNTSNRMTGNTCDDVDLPNVSNPLCAIMSNLTNVTRLHAQCLGGAIVEGLDGCPTCLKPGETITYGEGVRKYEGYVLKMENRTFEGQDMVSGVYTACPSMKYVAQDKGFGVQCYARPLKCDQGYRTVSGNTVTYNGLTKKCDKPAWFNATTNRWQFNMNCVYNSTTVPGKIGTYCGLNSWYNGYEIYDDQFPITVI